MGRVLVMSLCLVCLVAGCAPDGGPAAYVTVNVPPDDECVGDPDTELFISSGLYDIALGGSSRSRACQDAYYMLLKVNSALKQNGSEAIGRAEPNVLMLSDAEVRLIDVEQQATIGFDDLPNPFRVKVNNFLPPASGSEPQSGIVRVEAIPIGYDEQLSDYVGKQILAEVQIFGTTLGDVAVDFSVFEFPIRICDGCLTRCLSEDFDEGADPAATGGCLDGQDGRLCIDATDTCDPRAADR